MDFTWIRGVMTRTRLELKNYWYCLLAEYYLHVVWFSFP